MPRTERYLDDDGGPLVQFAADLRRLREKAGSPPYRKLAKTARYSSTTLADAAAGRKLPSLPVTLAYVAACAGDTRAWEARWHLLATDLAAAADADADAEPPGADENGKCPYVGLASFQPDAAAWYFGRERLTDALCSRVRSSRFVAVFGASGSGKSSLLHAGLLPRMAAGDEESGGPAWPTVVFSPGPHPLRECTAKLAAFTGTDGAPDLAAAVLRALDGRPKDVELLLVVDQFEEVFTLCPSAPERSAFIGALTTAASAPGSRVRVVVAIRADFYSECLRYPALVDALREEQVLVGPMSTDELRRAVSQPAVTAACTVESALLARVVVEATGRAGILPLVSHAMRETWRRRRGNTLTVSGYEAAGGIAHALANTAESVYRSLTAEQQRLARGIFLRLVSLGHGTEDYKRRLARDEFAASAKGVLDALARARLITLDTDTVEITHEALLHAWPRLAGWIREDRAGLAVQEQLAAAAVAWEREQRDRSALYRGARLAAAREWVRSHRDELRLSTRVQEFLAASARHEDRGGRIRRAAVAALALLSALALVSAGVAIQQRASARSERDSAVSAELTAEAEQLRGTDQSLAARLNLAAFRIQPTAAASTDLISTQSTALATPLTGHTGTVYAVAFSPSGHLLATAGGDDTIRLWNVRDRTHPSTLGPALRSRTGRVYWLAFSPDGRTLAVAGRDRTVRLWNLTRPAHPTAWAQPLTGHTSYVFSVSFSPDGAVLASASNDGTVRLWNVADPGRPTALGHPLDAHAGPVASAAFSPGGHTVAAAGHDHTIRLWNVTDPVHPRPWGHPLTGHTDTVYAVAFSPDGRVLASVGNDHTVRLWDVANPARPKRLAGPLTGHTDTVYAVAFGPDGHVLATAGADHTIRLWNVTDPAHPIALGEPLTGHTEYVYWLAFSPDGSTLASAGADRTVRLWSIPGTVLPTPSFVNTVAFGPSGRVLASGGTDGTIRLWDVSAPARPVALGRPLTGHSAAVSSVVFSPDGRMLASGGRDCTVRLWNVSDPAHPRPLGRPLTGHSAAVSSVVFSPDGRTLASGGRDRTVRLWDVSAPARPVALGRPLAGHSAAVSSVVFSPDGRTLASASADDTVRLWNVTKPAHPRSLGPPLAAHSGGVLDAAFSPSGRILATANVDHTVRLWNVAAPARATQLAKPLSGHTSFVLSVAFSPDGRTLASSGDDHTIRLWNVADPVNPAAFGKPLTGHLAPIDQVTFSPDGRTLASASDDHTIALRATVPADAIARICAATLHTLTRQQWPRYVRGLAFRETCP